MTKYHDLKTVIIDGLPLNYFYKREKNDINGNPRYRVYMFCNSGDQVIEKIFKTYESLIPKQIEIFIREEAER